LRRFEKVKATGKIDMLVALTMAVGAAMLPYADGRSVYDRIAAEKTPALEPEGIDYDALNNLRHPQHAEMLRRFTRQQENEDAFD
jgi:phage terminase large subunit-like protein